MISFITPTRGRAESLKKGLDSLGLVDGESEALVWLDTDDPQYDRYIELFENYPNVKLFKKERIGYSRFHEMMNFLAEQASYDWMILWNDDVTMDNPEWYGIFKDFASVFKPAKEPVVINIWGQGNKANLFPIVSRKYWEILGHFSLSVACDDWIRIVSMGANIAHQLLGIRPTHRKYHGDDQLVDETYHEVEAARIVSRGSWDPRKGPTKDQLGVDIAKLREYIESSSPDLSFLVPSRGRPEILKHSLDSLNLNEHRLEALVWLDDDDPKLEEYQKLFADNKRVKLFINKRVTYKNFHLMVNFLASQANGDWLFLWHDDVYMSEPGWFKTFQEYTSLVDPREEPVVFNHNTVSSNNTFFPIISRKYYEILGHIAPTAFSGWYVARLSANHRFQRPMFGLPIKHRDGDLDSNPEAVQDETKQEIEALKKKSRYLGFLSGSVSQRRNDDGMKINQAREKNHVGFIGLGKLGLPVALAMEARGNRVIGYDVNPAIKDHLSKFEVPFKEEGIETVLPWNRVELAETIKDLVGKTDLVFCAIQTPHDPRFEGHAPLIEERADFDY